LDAFAKLKNPNIIIARQIGVRQIFSNLFILFSLKVAHVLIAKMQDGVRMPAAIADRQNENNSRYEVKYLQMFKARENGLNPFKNILQLFVD